MITLILTPAKTPGKFIARLDGEIICQSDQPLVDGARVLVNRGFDPSLAMTVRHAGKAFDSFTAQRLSDLAKWTYSEGDRQGLHIQKWRAGPYSLVRSTSV